MHYVEVKVNHGLAEEVVFGYNLPNPVADYADCIDGDFTIVLKREGQEDKIICEVNSESEEVV